MKETIKNVLTNVTDSKVNRLFRNLCCFDLVILTPFVDL